VYYNYLNYCLHVESKEKDDDRKKAEAVHLFRRYTSTNLEEQVKAALDKFRLASGPIRCFVQGPCCKVLEDLAKLKKKQLFGIKDAETSILNKRASLLLGSDVNVTGLPLRNAPQNTVKWKGAAKELLAEQRRLLKEHFGDCWVILDQFDYGPQVLSALAQHRQRTHSDGISFFISGPLHCLFVIACCCAVS
jgi:hypothetical protein